MKEQSTTKGFAILSAAGMMVKVLSLLYIPFLLTIIGDEGYGIYGASYQIYVFVYVVTNSGMPVAISKSISELIVVKNYRDAVRSFKIARFIVLIIGIVMSALLLLFAGPMSKLLQYNKAYLSILTLAPAVLFTAISCAYRGYFQGRGNMIPTAVSQILEQIVNTVFSLIFAFYLMRYGVEAGCAGGSLGTSLGALVSGAFLIFYYEKTKTFKVSKQTLQEEPKRIPTKQLVKTIIKYVVPITICLGMTYAGNLVDLYNTKVRLMAGGITEVNATILYGCLNKYQQLMNVPISLISSLAVAILPAISAAAAINDRVKVKDKSNYSFRLCFLISLPCVVGLAVLSDPIFKLLHFGPGSYIMAYGSVVLVLMALMQIQTTILQSIGKLFTATFYSVIGIVFKIVVNYILIAIPSINILGAIVGSVVGFCIPIVLNHMTIKKTLKIKFNILKHVIKPTVASTFMGIVAYVIYHGLNLILVTMLRTSIANDIATIVAIFAGIATYFLGLVFVGGIRKSDLQVMPQRFKKLIPQFVMSRIY